MTHHPQGGTIFEGDAGYSGNLHQALMTLNVGENDDIDCWHTLLASLPKSNSTEWDRGYRELMDLILVELYVKNEC